MEGGPTLQHMVTGIEALGGTPGRGGFILLAHNVAALRVGITVSSARLEAGLGTRHRSVTEVSHLRTDSRSLIALNPQGELCVLS
jgi:hypothetical protein